MALQTGLPDESGFTLAFVMSAVGVSLAFLCALAIPSRRGAAGGEQQRSAIRRVAGEASASP